MNTLSLAQVLLRIIGYRWDDSVEPVTTRWDETDLRAYTTLVHEQQVRPETRQSSSTDWLGRLDFDYR